jgi:hypothetical protein
VRSSGPANHSSRLRVGVRSAETPAHLLLAMDLWDRSARSLLDDNNRVLKVSIELTRPGLECVKAFGSKV